MDQVVQLRGRSLATTDLDEAREILTRQYCSHSIACRDDVTPLDVRYAQAPLHHMSINYLQYGAEVDIRPRQFESFYLVHVPIGGEAWISAGGRQFHIRPGTAAIVAPRQELSTTWKAHCRQLMLKIDRRALETHLSSLIFQPIDRPLEFPATFDLNAGLGASFQTLIFDLASELARSDAVTQSRLVCTQIEQTLLTLILCGARHSYSDALQAAEGAACPKHVARAYQYMTANARENITIEDLTAVAGVSGRALYEGFRRFKGASPMACLRAIRMQAIRKELLDGKDTEDVTLIAQRWGFFHLGRFAANYQRIFGEKPSHTLRRRR